MFGCRAVVVGSIGRALAVLGVFVGGPGVRLRGEIVGGGEARVVQVGEARVVDGFADCDRHRIAVGVNDDLSWPEAIDGVAGDSAGRQHFGFIVSALVVPPMGGGVMEGGVHVDTVRVIQLVHIADLPEGAVGQPFQLSLSGEPVQIVGRDSTFPGNGALRALRQRHETVRVAASRITDMRADAEIVRVAGREAGAEDLRTTRIHAEQRVLGIQERICGAVIAPDRRQAVTVVIDHHLREVGRCHRAGERVTRHGPAQMGGQFAVGTTGFESVRFHVRVAPRVSGIIDLVRHYLGEIPRIELFGCLQQRGPLEDIMSPENQ
ncbi:hypothetical protein [Nocardia terpenica]|uniref:hypothetical protein n=1 Tax=Nocardia terpenica TaxID=455432 RepID=UPI002FE2BCCF